MNAAAPAQVFLPETASGLVRCWRFGDFELRPATRELLQHGREVSIGSRAFDLLCALVQRNDRTVAADELQALVWPRVVVEPNNLHVQVWHLRHLLGRDVITNRPGAGYRFTPKVRVHLLPVRHRAQAHHTTRHTRAPIGPATVSERSMRRLHGLSQSLCAAVATHRFVSVVASPSDSLRWLATNAIENLRAAMTGGVWTLTAADLGASVLPRLVDGADAGWSSADDLQTRLDAAAGDVLPLRSLSDRKFLLVYWRLAQGVPFERPFIGHLNRVAPGLHLLAIGESAIGDEREHVFPANPVERRSSRDRGNSRSRSAEPDRR